MTVKPLSQMANGERGRVVKVGVSGDIRRRLMDMGLVNGSEIEMEPLCAGDPGRPLTVVGFRGGPGMQRRLADMGLPPGTELKLISRDNHGPVIIELRGSRLALGRGVAHHIIVKES